MKKIYLLLFVLMGIISCTSVKTDPVPKKISSSIVTTRYSDNFIPINSAFQWAPDQIKFYDDKRLENSGLHDLIKTSIVNELSNKGYVFEPEAPVTDFLIAYVAGLKSSLSDSEIESIYGINPGLPDNQPNAREQEKGTIIVNIINPENRRVIWRGVGQAFATLKDIPQNVREERLQIFMQNMFSDFPRVVQ